MARQPLSKKTRFEVFKRDSFTCQYCGNTPPAVILHCDHIVAVASGGKNDMDNLITSCEACNQGKGARDLKAVPPTLAAKAALVAEAEAKLKGFQKIFAKKRKRIEEEAWKILDELLGCPQKVPMDWLRGTKRFIERMGFDECLHSVECTKRRNITQSRAFQYFCGVCWSKLREAEKK